jgi:autotransporter-associated beta strand protein
LQIDQSNILAKAVLFRRALLASTALVGLISVQSASAADTNWIQNGAGSWSTDANWDNNQPTAATNLTTISNGGVAQISTDAFAGSNFNSGTHLNVTNGSTVLLLGNGTLTFGGDADFNGSTLALSGSTAVHSSTPGGAVTLTNSTISSNLTGTLSSSVLSLAGDNRIVAANGTTLTLGPSEAFGVAGTSTLHFGAVGNTGTVVFEGANNLTTSGSAKIVIDGGSLTGSSTPNNHALADLTSGVQSVTVASGGALLFEESLRAGSVAIRNLLGSGEVGAAEDNTTALGITQGNFGGQIFTNGGLRVMGGASGTLILTADQTYSGGTTIDAGHTLQLGSNGNFGSISGDVLNNGTLIINRSNSVSFDSAISGTGRVVQAGNGSTTLTGNNSYAGGTFIQFGLLKVSSDANLGAASGGITFEGNNGTLQYLASFDSNRAVFINGVNPSIDTNGFNATWNGALSGTGAFLKDGNGVLTLAAANNTFSGDIAVGGGSLIVNGSASGAAVEVGSGALLGGRGTVGSTIIDSGGKLSPGNSIGTLSVNGTLAVNGGSYLVEVAPNAADRTNVTGALTIGAGSSVSAFGLGGAYLAHRYTIMNAASRTGTFDLLTTAGNFGNFVTNPHLEYDARNIYFVLDPTSLAPMFGALPLNQTRVGNAISQAYVGGADISNFFGVLNLTGAQLAGGLSQITGEAATGSQQTTFNSMNMFMGVLTDPFVAGRSDPATPAAGDAPAFADRKNPANSYAAFRSLSPTTDSFAQRWSVWAAGYGGSQTTDGNVGIGSNAATSRIAGTAVGADYRFSPDTLAGFAMAGGGTNFSVSNALGSGRSDLFQLGAFVRHTAGSAYISAAFAYGWQDITTDRTVTVAGVDHLQAKFNANAFSGRLESGYRFVTPLVGITPYAAAQVTTFDLPAYAERAVTGSAAFALTYTSKNVTDTRSELGLRTDKSVAMQDAILTLRGRLAWAHDFNPDRNVAATFQSLPGASFVVDGAAQAHDAALTTASLEMKWLNGWSTAATFEGEFSNVTRSYAGKGVVRYAW